MKVALLGATGAIGSAYLERALADGHEVRALVLDPARSAERSGFTQVIGDARHPDAVRRTLSGADSVVSAVGPRRNSAEAVELMESTTANVIASMRAEQLSRIVFVAGAGLAMPGETRALGQRLISSLVKRLAKWVVASKKRELELYLESGLDWTALRPPRVIRGPASGAARLTYDRPNKFRVTSGDVAAAIALALHDPETIGKAPYISA